MNFSQKLIHEKPIHSLTPDRISLAYDPGVVISADNQEIIFSNGVFDLAKSLLRPDEEFVEPVGLRSESIPSATFLPPMRIPAIVSNYRYCEFDAFPGIDKDQTKRLWMGKIGEVPSKSFNLPSILNDEPRLVQSYGPKENKIAIASVSGANQVTITELDVDAETKKRLFSNIPNRYSLAFNPANQVLLGSNCLSRGMGAAGSVWEVDLWKGIESQQIVCGNANVIRPIMLGKDLAVFSEMQNGYFLMLDIAKWPATEKFRFGLTFHRNTFSQLMSGVELGKDAYCLLDEHGTLMAISDESDYIRVTPIALKIGDEEKAYLGRGRICSNGKDVYIKYRSLYRLDIDSILKEARGK